MAVRIKTLNLVYIALFAVLIAICSWLAIPTIVPITLQTLAVYLTVSLLGWKRGLAAICVYILLGLVGVPVFSGFRAGMGVLAGPTGGYIIGFIFLSLIMGAFIHRFGNGKMILFIAMLLGTIVCYAFGTIWYLLVYAQTTEPVGWLTALSLCVFPFILPDILKMLLAIFISKRLLPYIKN